MGITLPGCPDAGSLLRKSAPSSVVTSGLEGAVLFRLGFQALALAVSVSFAVGTKKNLLHVIWIVLPQMVHLVG